MNESPIGSYNIQNSNRNILYVTSDSHDNFDSGQSHGSQMQSPASLRRPSLDSNNSNQEYSNQKDLINGVRNSNSLGSSMAPARYYNPIYNSGTFQGNQQQNVIINQQNRPNLYQTTQTSSQYQFNPADHMYHPELYIIPHALQYDIPSQNSTYNQLPIEQEIFKSDDDCVLPLSSNPYGIAPQMRPQPLFRHKTTRLIELTSAGNYVVEVGVPQRILKTAKIRSAKEFTHLRYSAVTGDPDEFVSREFSLRPADAKRVTEIFVVITMYNENELLFIKTWKTVIKNIAYICGKRKSVIWGPDGWTKIVVCIVSDGRAKIHEKTLAVLGILGVYQDGIIRTSVNKEEVSAHVFEFTTQVSLDLDVNSIGQESTIPIQTIFCLKEKNSKKINSHRWFFNAFGATLKPKVCILIDVGTKPTDRSFYRLWK
ncbi:Chitin synthase, class 1, partial [Nowakowskiella sp. JEL0078]